LHSWLAGNGRRAAVAGRPAGRRPASRLRRQSRAGRAPPRLTPRPGRPRAADPASRLPPWLR